MLLVDVDIKNMLEDNRIVIFSNNDEKPFIPSEQIGPGSIDLRLGNSFRKYKPTIDTITGSLENATDLFSVDDDQEITIQPNEIILALTIENVLLPPNIAAFITGRSSIARLGLMVQATQDFIQPGSKAPVPLQLINVTNKPIKIKPMLRICQIILFRTSSSTEKPYSSQPQSKYRDETSIPNESELYKEINPKTANSKNVDQVDPKIEQIGREIDKTGKESPSDQALNALLSAVNLILGGAIGAIIIEWSNSRFSSNEFTFSLFIIIFCLIMIIIANWRKIQK
ncbi:MAG: hypothetical protein OHK0022_28690 [Roseiflexaceae bacterium]